MVGVRNHQGRKPAPHKEKQTMPTVNNDSVVRFFENDAQRNLDAATENMKRARERLAMMLDELDRAMKRIEETESKLGKTDLLGNLASSLSGGAGVLKDIARDASERAFGARKTLEVLAALDHETVEVR